MPRIDLLVPFAEKEEAKRLGARWDANLKVWFVPHGVEPSAFGRWLPEKSSKTIRSSEYFIAQTDSQCWKCEKLTPVYGFLLPPGYETLLLDEKDESKDEWQPHDEPTIISYVTDLPPTVATRMKTLARHYRVDFSKTTQSSYWMNHCEHCGMKQGDFELFGEPGGAFYPLDRHDASNIILHPFAEPFESNGNWCEYNSEGHFFEYMRRNAPGPG